MPQQQPWQRTKNRSVSWGLFRTWGQGNAIRTHLVVDALQTGVAGEAAGPGGPSAGVAGLANLGGGESQDLVSGVLRGDDDGGRRVAGRLTREDGPVDDEEVVGAVDLGVGVDDGASAVAAIIVTQLGSA